MINIKLSKRLSAIASLVDKNAILADIGCDHALLDIFLIKEKIIKIDVDPISLEKPTREDEDSCVADFIKDESNMSPEEYAINSKLKDEISEVLLTLTEREEQVLKLRFGLEDGTCRTLEEVGNMFGVTRERIRQIEAKALRKLRHPSRSKKLKDYLND